MKISVVLALTTSMVGVAVAMPTPIKVWSGTEALSSVPVQAIEAHMASEPVVVKRQSGDEWYPDPPETWVDEQGKRWCKIFSATAGHTISPCPLMTKPVPGDHDLREHLSDTYCGNTNDGKICHTKTPWEQLQYEKNRNIWE